MAEIKEFKPEDFIIVPVKGGCNGCVFLDTGTGERICATTRDLDLMDLAIGIDRHFGVNCLKNRIVYKLKH